MIGEQRAALLGHGMDASNVLTQNVRGLARTLANITPPIRERGNKGSPRLNGEDRINKELCSLFSEATTKLIDETGSRFGLHGINTFVDSKDGSKLHLIWDTIDPMGSHMKEEHDKARGSRGTVNVSRRDVPRGTWKARVVVPQGFRAPYIKGVQARVGRGKCSMGLVGMRLGDDYPAWIARHKQSIGDIAIININMSNPAFPQITFGSRAPGIGRIKERAQAAVKLRTAVIKRHIKLILEDYKDWRTVRAKANARRRSSGGVPGQPEERVE